MNQYQWPIAKFATGQSVFLTHDKISSKGKRLLRRGMVGKIFSITRTRNTPHRAGGVWYDIDFVGRKRRVSSIPESMLTHISPW